MPLGVNAHPRYFVLRVRGFPHFGVLGMNKRVRDLSSVRLTCRRHTWRLDGLEPTRLGKEDWEIEDVDEPDV